jgi:hypothetical protein
MSRRAFNRGLAKRLICVVLAFSMATGPSMILQAQVNTKVAAPADARTGTIDTTHIPPGAAVVAVLRPAQLMNSPASELLPVEVATAAGLKHLGIDPAKVAEVTASVDPSNPSMPSYVVALKFIEPITGVTLPNKLRAHAKPDELNGKKYLKSEQPMLPSFYSPDKQTLIIAPDETLKRLVDKPVGGQAGPFFERVRNVKAGNDLYVAVDIATLRPFIQLGLMQAQRNMPPDARPFVESINKLSAAELTLNLSKPGASSLVVHANDEAAAKDVETVLADGVEKAREKMRIDMAPQMASDDPVERSFAQYMERVSGRWAETMVPKREGRTFTIFRLDGTNSQQQQLATTAVIGVLVALLLPAVQAAREAARRNHSMNNMKNIMLAFHNHHDTKRGFPAHAIYNDEGKPLLSWRVQILPYIEQQELYAQFHLDEPWDSEHNKALIARMPEVYKNPNAKLDDGKTNYLAVVGKECFMDGTEKGVQIQHVTDGTSNTIAVVEADLDKAVEWTKPDDFQFDPNNPTAGLGHVRPGGWIAGFVDGSVQFISSGIDPNIVKAMFTRGGGEVVNR